MADYNPMTDPNRAGQGYGTNGKDIWSPVQNRWITPSEVSSFLSTNPNQRQILSQAASLGLTQQDLNTAIKGQGYSEQVAASKYNNLANNLWTGGLGFSSQDTEGHGAYDGKIIAGNGHYESTPGKDGGSWIYGAPSNITFGEDGGVSGGGSYSGGSGGGSYGGGSGGGSSSSSYSSSSGGLNPYLDQMAGSITNQLNTNWERNLAPSIRSGAMAAGGFGGSRQGVVEANGLRDLNQTLGNSLANLYGTGWQNAQQNALQNKSLDNSYALGVMNNNLGYANLDSNNSQFGANLALNILNAQNAWAQNGVNAANQLQMTPLQYQQYFNNMQNSIGGQGGTNTTSQTNQGNPWLGAVGGLQLANSWIK